MHHINVGQGGSIYIEFPDGTDALIDEGKSNSGDTVIY
ncbi:beta-lactamase superfamily II metal-dependent hydrolase [Paeniclostridium ghonii]|uniref:Beta-lactamase superfamily II metal-dependent hydrolase n=1 Tax=Paraclostridium ghonii TaxID=29358 RepID=A0ABU0MX53_9FIRM|nr:beta-lactamase superfamily II metal-dependent hydrolase [Paeniclostridium ghonii]